MPGTDSSCSCRLKTSAVGPVAKPSIAPWSCGQRRGVGPGDPREEQPIVSLVDAVDREHGHALGTRRQPRHHPAGEPAAQRRRLAGDERVGLEEDRSPADPPRRGRAGGRHPVEPHRAIDGKQRDAERERRDVVYAAAAGRERSGRDGGIGAAHGRAARGSRCGMSGAVGPGSSRPAAREVPMVDDRSRRAQGGFQAVRLQAMEQVCRRTKRRSSTLETLGVSSGRPSGKRSGMTFSTDS